MRAVIQASSSRTTQQPLSKLLSCLLTGCLLLLPVTAGATQSLVVQDIDFGTVDSDDFEAGVISNSREPVWWESASAWRIAVEALDSNLGSSTDGGYLKPLNDLEFKLHEYSQWTTMLQQPQVLKESSDTGSGTIYVDWRIRLSWAADRPGQYGANLLFTISEL